MTKTETNSIRSEKLNSISCETELTTFYAFPWSKTEKSDFSAYSLNAPRLRPSTIGL